LGENPHPDSLQTPDILLMVADELLVMDNLSGKLTVLVLADVSTSTSATSVKDAFDYAQQRLGVIVRQLQTAFTPLPMGEKEAELLESDFISEMGEAEYKNAVNTIKDYISAGDCMQVVLSHRLTAPFKSHPLNLYRALRTTNPSPYMFYLDLGNHQVVGASPEILVKLENDQVTVRPIAGTRPRGANDAQDNCWLMKKKLQNISCSLT